MATKGPWRVGRAISDQANYIMGSDKEIIGSIFNDHGGANQLLVAAAPSMYDALVAEIQSIEDTVVQLEEWAYESVKGGWSTHQVDRNKRLAQQLKQRQSELRLVIWTAEGRQK